MTTTDIALASILDRLTALEKALDRLTIHRADGEDMLNIEQAAAYLGITPSAVYHLDLPKYKAGKGGKTSRSYYKRSDLDRHVRGRRVPSRQEQQAHSNIKALEY